LLAHGDDAAGPGAGAVFEVRELLGAAPATLRQAVPQQRQRMAAQRQAGGGVVERDGLALRGFEQVGLLGRPLDDRRLGQQAGLLDALLAVS
jgi:hypothetical protein